VRILTFTSLFPSSCDPTHAIFVYQRCAHLARRPDNEVIVVSPVPYFPSWLKTNRWRTASQVPTEERIGSLTVYHPRYFLLPKIFMTLHAVSMFLGCRPEVARLNERAKLDCIDAHFVYPDGLAAVLLGKFLGVPVIVSARGSDIHAYPAFRTIRPMIRWTLQHADALIAVSASLKKSMIELGASADKIHVIPNGIDPPTLLKLGTRARELASRFGVLSSDVVMLAPVRITKRKNLEWAIEAAAGVRASGRRVQLLITGPPGPHNPRALDYVDDLKHLRDRLGLRESVHFLFEEAGGPQDAYAVDAATLSDLYMLSDVVVLPSASEGFGLPLAEAAIFRVPVVCTDLPAFREVAPEGATFVPADGGSDAFTAAVLTAIESPPSRLRRHVLGALSWDRLVTERVEPLLSTPA